MIWDRRDEVIPDSASVKGGIFMEFLRSKKDSNCHDCTNCLKSYDENPLN